MFKHLYQVFNETFFHSIEAIVKIIAVVIPFIIAIIIAFILCCFIIAWCENYERGEK